jgi:SAM-dependent methyltransferase
MPVNVDPSIRAEQASWSDPTTEAFYRSHRNSPDDLYPSERAFLPDVLPRVRSMLDVGCAAGGFSRIARAFNPDVRYVGADITPALVEAARRDHPDAELCVSDGVSFPYAPNSFDLVHCSGVLHLNSRYRDMIRAMWRIARAFLIFDVRLTAGEPTVGSMPNDLGDRSAAALPYYVLNTSDFVGELRTLDPAPAAIRARGYPHAPASSARLAVDRVTMAVFLLEKRAGSTGSMEIDVRVDGAVDR